MEGNKLRPRAILIFGAPCSGKTTFGEKFAKKFGLAFYDFDKIRAEGNFSRKDILAILELITRTRQTIIIEGEVHSEARRSEIRNLLRNSGYDPSLVWIQTDVSTIRNRLKQRHKKISTAKEIYEKAIDELEAPTDIEKPIILSGKHTFETQAKHVITGLAELDETK